MRRSEMNKEVCLPHPGVKIAPDEIPAASSPKDHVLS